MMLTQPMDIAIDIIDTKNSFLSYDLRKKMEKSKKLWLSPATI